MSEGLFPGVTSCPLWTVAGPGLFPPATAEPCALAPRRGCGGPADPGVDEPEPLQATCPIFGCKLVPELAFQLPLLCAVGYSPVPSHCSPSPLIAERFVAANVMFSSSSAGAEPDEVSLPRAGLLCRSAPPPGDPLGAGTGDGVGLHGRSEERMRRSPVPIVRGTP